MLIYYLTVLWVRSPGGLNWVFHSVEGLKTLKSRCWLNGPLIWRLWGKNLLQVHSGCWQNLVPCGCRSRVLVSFWAVSQREHSVLKNHLHFFSIFSASNGTLIPSHTESDFLFYSHRRKLCF